MAAFVADYSNTTTIEWPSERWATTNSTGYWTWKDGTTPIEYTSASGIDWELRNAWTHETTSFSNVTWREWVTGYVNYKQSPKDKLKQMLKERMAPTIITNSRRNPIDITNDAREKRARETLHRVLGNQKFKNFLKTGFVSVKAKSGLVYQIFPGHGISCVFKNGKMIDRLCVVLSGNFPPTDSLIMRYLMILNDENQFKSLAIKHGVYQPEKTMFKNPEQKSLVELYEKIKAA